MSIRLAFTPLLMLAAPAVAQPSTPQPPAEIQRVLSDPATADRLTNVMQTMSKVFLDLPVGGIEAALEGRQASPAESKRTIRDIARQDDPNFERDFNARIAQSGPMIRHSMKALADALPGMMKGMQEAQKSLERAATNMPDPTYPKR